jgi:hypothetical protein
MEESGVRREESGDRSQKKDGTGFRLMNIEQQNKEYRISK